MKTIEQVPNVIDWSRPVGVHCIDDRGYENSGQNIKLGGASSYGLAYDTYAARAIDRNGKLDVDLSAGELAKVITKGLSRYALLACTHHECAAEAGVGAVADQFTSNGESILRETNRILDGSVNESEFEKLQYFYAQLASNEKLFRGVDIEAVTMDTDGSHPMIERSRLAHEYHAATSLRINSKVDTWHDASTAYANGLPEYGYDIWALRPTAEKIDAIVPHDNIDGFALASVARVVATSRLLPRDSTRSGIDIVIG
ncbi:hypothetical protein D3C85_166250 [compost metagenome]